MHIYFRHEVDKSNKTTDYYFEVDKVVTIWADNMFTVRCINTNASQLSLELKYKGLSMMEIATIRDLLTPNKVSSDDYVDLNCFKDKLVSCNEYRYNSTL